MAASSSLKTRTSILKIWAYKFPCQLNAGARTRKIKGVKKNRALRNVGGNCNLKTEQCHMELQVESCNKTNKAYFVTLLTNVGSVFSRILGRLWGDKEVRILILGLDGAGKTTILYRLQVGEVVTTIPSKSSSQII